MRRYWPLWLLLLALPFRADATGTLSVPNTFGGLAAGAHNVSLIDDNFTSVENYVNNREVTADVLANRPAASTAGRWYFATDTSTLYLDTGSTWLTISQASTVSGIHRVASLTGTNNAGTPASQYDLTAGAVVLRNPTDGSIIVRTNPGTLTVNLATTGANGLDTGAQATAFYNLYYIWNGTTLSTVASLADASAGPSLPSGYTFWAWATTIRSTASLANSYVRGCRVYWQEARQLIINSTGTGETTVSVATLTAPNAKSTALFLDAASGGGTSTTFLRLVTGVNFMQASRYAAAGGFNTQVWLPNVGQQFLYQRGAGDAFDIWHAGYGFCDD